MPLPASNTIDMSGYGFGAENIDKTMSEQTSSEIQQKYPQMKWIGHGNKGIVYECEPGIACKITGIPYEAKIAKIFKNQPHPNIIRIIDVSEIQNYPPLWVIKTEKVQTLNQNEKNMVDELMQSFDYNDLKFDTGSLSRYVDVLRNKFGQKVNEIIDEIENIFQIKPTADVQGNNLGWSATRNLVLLDLD